MCAQVVALALYQLENNNYRSLYQTGEKKKISPPLSAQGREIKTYKEKRRGKRKENGMKKGENSRKKGVR